MEGDGIKTIIELKLKPLVKCFEAVNLEKERRTRERERERKNKFVRQLKAINKSVFGQSYLDNVCML